MKRLFLFCCMILAVVLSQAQVTVEVITPSSISGSYVNTWADPAGGWGTPDLTIPANSVEDTIMLVDDGTTEDSLGCNTLINNLTGKIAVVYRGTCQFGLKALNAQNAGAVAVIIINNAAGGPVNMAPGTDGGNVTIPVVMLSQADGATLDSAMDTGTDVVVFIGTRVFNTSITSSNTCVGCDGTASVTVTQGVPPYTYLWNTGPTSSAISGLCNGTYMVLSTDSAGNSITDTVVIISEPVTQATISPDNDTTVCSPVTLVANFTFFGTYLWSTGATSQSIVVTTSGTYTVTITETCGSSTSAPVTITFSGATLSISGINASCGAADGSTTVVATSGTTPYTYLWNDPNSQTTTTATGLTAGTYSVTVTDGSGCTNSSSVSITGANGPTVTTLGTNPSSCGSSDGIATSGVTGGTPPYTYSWSSGGNTATESNLGAGTYMLTLTDAAGCIVTSSVVLTSPGAPTTTTNSSDASCTSASGTASVFANGGTSPYTYQWDDPAGQNNSIATGLTTGSYNVTVTDNAGCMAFDNAVVGSSGTGPSLSFITTEVTCYGGNDGSAAVAASGASAPYTYLWSNGESVAIIVNLMQGAYSLTVTDNNGCQSIDSIIIAGPAQIVATNTSVEPSCGNNDGEATLNPTGGTSPYSYLWESNAGNQTTQTATGLGAGSYSVTITDGLGCTENILVGLSNSGAPVVVVTGSDVTCFGANNGTAVATVSGGTPPLVYLWSNGSNNLNLIGLSGGTYTLTVTDSLGCLSVKNINIDEPNAVVVTTSYTVVSTGTSCDGQALAIVSGGTLPYSYLWNDPIAQTNALATGLCIGPYTVIVDDANACSKAGSVYVDSVIVIISIAETSTGLSVFPNPSDGTLTLTFESDNVEVEYIEVVNLKGQRIYFEAPAAVIQSYEISIGEHSTGLYFLKIATGKGMVEKKIVLY